MGIMPRDTEEPADEAFRICMVCTGNICRSPMAEVVLRDLVERAGLGGKVVVTSAGTGEWHVGEHADPRTVAALEARGYDGSAHRARQFDASWFDDLDLVIALDHNRGPIRPGRGSAIFLHVARGGFLPTEGCVALRRADLVRLLRRVGPGTRMRIG